MLKSGSLNVLWFDPGGTTGWCCYSTNIMVTRLEEGTVPKIEFHGEKWNMGELGPGDHHQAMWNLIGTLHADNFVLGYESFEFRQGKQRDNIVLDSKEYIGVCKLYYQMTNPSVKMYLKSQTAADGKGFWYPKKPGTQQRDVSKLKALGLYTPGSTHMNDATAHTLHWLVEGPLNRRDLLLRLREKAAP
jgi:hypothetical protein